ncbi:CATRA conflict system CASPASE/TPR repeat-associated protein [Streptosporangium sp. NPDC002524]|uniref:CATRA conflict system CASPASE/TPR repeat-associated protein n=1 Tax=Streptosporangium sp. NPDC002524 TaxID=3154537 RepID=UPI00331765DD
MRTTANVSLVAEQELVAHVFVVEDGWRREGCGRTIELLTARGEEHLGTTNPIPLRGGPFDGVIALRQSPGRDAQLLTRRENGVVCVSVLLAASREAPDPADALTPWQRMDRLLDAVVGDVTEGLIGVVRLYLGKHTDPAGAGAELAPLLPPAGQETGWWNRDSSSGSGLTAWELTSRPDSRIERRIVVLAPPDGNRQLSVWTWSDGTPLLPPLARYLQHVAKIRYELRVLSRARPASELCRLIESGILELHGLVNAAGRSAGPFDRDAIGCRLDSLRADQARAAARIAKLKTMRRTVAIATASGRAALEGDAAGQGYLFHDDTELFSWFERQLEDDISYLESAYEGAARLGESLERFGVPHRPARPPATVPRPVVGIVTAMPEEFVAMRAMLENRTRTNVAGDRANYVVGTLPGLAPDVPHHVVLTLLGDTGNDSAADGCANLVRSFDSVAQILMVGIAAGVPDPVRPERHVRLGDIVVSTWGIVDYDHVIDRVGGPVLRQPFPRPSRLLTHHANWLAAEELQGRRAWEALLSAALEAGLPDFARPPAATDQLFLAEEPTHLVPHPDPRLSGHRPGWPKVHHGHIGSADHSLRNARVRAELAAEHNLRALEMEGKGIGNAGFANGLEWLVIRGISDYGDSRTDNVWRKYASLVAASYARALLAVCPPIAPRGGHTGAATLSGQ